MWYFGYPKDWNMRSDVKVLGSTIDLWPYIETGIPIAPSNHSETGRSPTLIAKALKRASIASNLPLT